MKTFINIALALYFFIGMDVIYWNIHANDYKQANYTFSNGRGGTGVASKCYEANEKKFCKTAGYSIEVAEYWEV